MKCNLLFICVYQYFSRTMNIFCYIIGRYNEGDPKRWKANFRCALNSLKDVQEVKDLSISKGQNAFRVYRMLEARKKAEKSKFTKRLKVEPGTTYIADDTKCVLKGKSCLYL